LDHDPRKIRLVMDLRSRGIGDVRVLAAIEQVPREAFVSGPMAARAYDDAALPIACGQTISQPFVVAFMTQALQVNDRIKVLEVGTGSGYQAAVLARLCRRVYTIERYGALMAEAEARFAALGLTNVTTRVGDGTKGWPEQAPFERILVTAAAAKLPATLVDQLAVGGRMILPVGPDPERQDIVLVTRAEDGGIVQEPLMPARFVPLVAGLVSGR
jgi:protein-L-isoaspartate(D-aspartate) O-methyltransferase